jgi:hypothetical protein
MAAQPAGISADNLALFLVCKPDISSLILILPMIFTYLDAFQIELRRFEVCRKTYI